MENDFVKMGQNSKKFVEEKFDWIQIAKKTFNEYKELLK